MPPNQHIQLIKWPTNSPDLNLIENAWSWMKVQLRETKPTNLEELKDEIRKLWVLRMDNSPYLKKLVESMPDRIQEVIQRDGNVPHYQWKLCVIYVRICIFEKYKKKLFFTELFNFYR